MKRGLLPDRVPACVEAWPWPYRLRAFGSFEITTEDDPPASAKSGTVKGRARGLQGMPLRLLQALVAFGARDVREHRLIDALWPDAEGDAGRRVFDTTLHRLRRQIGNEIVRLDQGRLRLDERQCWVDVWALEDVLAELDRQLGRKCESAVLEDLARRLLGVYRGPLFGDDPPGSPWARQPRERFAAKFLRAVAPLGKALEHGAMFDTAAAMYGRVLEGDPLAEPAYIGLTRCAKGGGPSSDAARLYQEHRTHRAVGSTAHESARGVPAPDPRKSVRPSARRS